MITVSNFIMQLAVRSLAGAVSLRTLYKICAVQWRMGSTGPSELLRGLLVVVVSERMNLYS